MSKGETDTNVRVICRVRPANKSEIAKGKGDCVKLSPKSVMMTSGSEENFTFDAVFGPKSTQAELFTDAALPLVHDILEGYNATIFAYGQTSSGKTYTMEGSDIRSERDKGIIPRVVEALFESVADADENIEFQFLVSYVEVYMEKIRDLLDENQIRTNLSIREDKVRGVYIAGVAEEYVTSVDDMLSVMAKGALNRSVAATGMNEGSSRSHSVFTIKVHQRNIGDGTKTEGKLVLVDLAGSEMVRKTNVSGQQLEEAKTINKSLSALGQVINALTDDKQSHIPYRDSKLTRILQDSLGGNSKTVLIIACSPSNYNASETQSTLRFGNRAKSIKNVVTVNQTKSVEELENLLLRAERAIDTQQAHIMSLVARLQAADGDSLSQNTIESGNVTSGTVDNSIVERLQTTIDALTNELEEEKEDSIRKDMELEGLTEVIREKERLLSEAGELMLEAQKHYESQKERADHVTKEKIDITSNLERIRSQLQDELSRCKFEVQELEVTVETMKAENNKLSIELSELGGGRDVDMVGDSGVGLSARRSVVVTRGDSEEHLTALSRVDIEENISALSVLLTNIGITDIKKANEVKSFMKKCLEGNSGGNIVNGNNNSATGSAGSAGTSKVASKRITEIETQRAKLLDDLHSMTQKTAALQLSLDGQQQENHDVGMITKCLQQRLEQLVVVHRQLLRRFAKLELDNVDLKKKILLRDERMRQLEGNSRGLSATLRQQAENHATELTTLRQQVLELRNEHTQRMENKSQEVERQSLSKGPKVVRGGGGGAGIVRMNNASANNSPDDKNASQKTGFLSRIFS
jgi:kinesin family member 5